MLDWHFLFPEKTPFSSSFMNRLHRQADGMGNMMNGIASSTWDFTHVYIVFGSSFMKTLVMRISCLALLLLLDCYGTVHVHSPERFWADFDTTFLYLRKMLVLLVMDQRSTH